MRRVFQRPFRVSALRGFSPRVPLRSTHGLRSPRLRLDIEVRQQTIDRTRVENDLLVAAGRAGLGRGQLQAVESALAGARLAAVLGSAALLAFEVLLAAQQRQQRVGAKLIVIVEVLT